MSERRGAVDGAGPCLAFLHTAAVHEAFFEALVRAQAPRQRTHHVVDPGLLAEARAAAAGAGDAGVVTRVEQAMQRAAHASGAAVVVCTCSTLGGVAERAVAAAGSAPFRALRIDRAMADAAVRLGPRVHVIVALSSTLQPTLDLLQDAARQAGCTVQATQQVLAEAWSHFERGDRPAYQAAVEQAARAAPADATAIVLAQASMDAAAQALQGHRVPVLCSPRLGVQAALARLTATAG